MTSIEILSYHVAYICHHICLAAVREWCVTRCRECSDCMGDGGWRVMGADEESSVSTFSAWSCRVEQLSALTLVAKFVDTVLLSSAGKGETGILTVV